MFTLLSCMNYILLSNCANLKKEKKTKQKNRRLETSCLEGNQSWSSRLVKGLESKSNHTPGCSCQLAGNLKDREAG